MGFNDFLGKIGAFIFFCLVIRYIHGMLVMANLTFFGGEIGKIL